MSALPAEVPPSGPVPAKTDTAKTDTAKTDTGPRGRSRAGGAQARPSVHPLFPSKRWVLPDGDCIFPGGGERFSGQAAPRAQRPAQAPRPADARGASGGLTPSGRPASALASACWPGRRRKAGRVAGRPLHRPRRHQPGAPGRPITSARHATVLNRIASADRATPASRAALASRPAAVGQTAVVGRATAVGLAAPVGLRGPGRLSGPGPPRGRARGRDCRAASAAADQAGPHRRGHPGRPGRLWPVRGGSQCGPGERSRGRARQCHAGDRPARRHALVDRPERRPERRRPGRRAADPAGQPSHEPGHHGRAAAVGATRLRALDGT